MDTVGKVTLETYQSIRVGLGSYSDSALADYLMRQAINEDHSPVLKSALAEAAARIDSATYLEYWGKLKCEPATES